MTSLYASRFRTHTSSELHQASPGDHVTVCGWFSGLQGEEGEEPRIELADRFGRTQVILSGAAGLGESIGVLNQGDVLTVQGKVLEVSGDGLSPAVVEAEQVQLINRSEALPLDIYGGDEVVYEREDRLRYRYLDLRRSLMQQRLQLRSETFFSIRSYLIDQGFLEIDTPMLSPWTPDATTAFVVPANAGEVYSLPQSAQLWKQLLMVGGCDRYFQLARCFRREPVLTPDRQPEFTTLDLELSWVDEHDVMTAVDGLLAQLWPALMGEELSLPIQRLSYDAAMTRYGTDRPDLRYGLEIIDLTELAAESPLPVIREAVRGSSRPGGAVRAIRIPVTSAEWIDSDELDSLNLTQPHPDKVTISWFRVNGEGELTGPMGRLVPVEQLPNLHDRLETRPGDVVVLLWSRNRHAATVVSGHIRQYLGNVLGLIDPAKQALVWVHSFPYWAYDVANDCFVPKRHPFSQPHDSDLGYLDGVGPMEEGFTLEPPGGEVPTQGLNFDRMVIRYGDTDREDLVKIRTRSYDLVLNGSELGAGSVRPHSLELQEKILSMFGYTRDVVDRRFGFLLEALQYGAPPHGGIALGIERLLALSLGLEDISEVIAFPKDTRGADAMSRAPGPIDPGLLRSLLGAPETPAAAAMAGEEEEGGADE